MVADYEDAVEDGLFLRVQRDSLVWRVCHDRMNVQKMSIRDEMAQDARVLMLSDGHERGNPEVVHYLNTNDSPAPATEIPKCRCGSGCVIHGICSPSAFSIPQ